LWDCRLSRWVFGVNNVGGAGDHPNAELMESIAISRSQAKAGQRVRLTAILAESWPVAFEVELTPQARRHLNKLSEKVQDVAIATMLGSTSDTRSVLASRWLSNWKGCGLPDAATFASFTKSMMKPTRLWCWEFNTERTSTAHGELPHER
jgi:hypothetical protein